jgi:hypothetical protein
MSLAKEKTQELIEKGCLYIQLGKHMHPRGMRDVVVETKVLVNDCVKAGLKFSDVKREIEEFVGNGYVLELENDKFMTAVRDMFQEEGAL